MNRVTMATTDVTQSLDIMALGELEVRLGGQLVPLPQSRKTRALLAYLALAQRAHRRDRLTSLFWDVTDDARAALRWSLTKLRRVVNAGDVVRLDASRSHVELRRDAITLDVSVVRQGLRAGIGTLPTDTLIDLARKFRGELLEGMFLPDFDEFEAWLEAERAEARGLRIRVLRELVERHADQPVEALRYARAWLHATAGNDDEAKQRIEALSSRLGQAPASTKRGDAPPRSVLSPLAVRRATTPFVVRDRELSRLQAAAAAVRAGAGPQLVVVNAGPGLGKTRLLLELAQREQERAAILHGECHEAERSRSFGPFIDALRRLDATALPAEGMELLETLRTGVPQGIADAESLFSSFAALVRHLATRSGLCLLVLDDVHLTDESSAELLHYLVRASAGAPLLVVAGCRAPDLLDNAALQRCVRGLQRHGATDELALEPLSSGEVRRLLQAIAPTVSADEIASRAAGNPFFALELARSTVSELSPSLTEAIFARLETIDPQAQALVRWAAVFDRASLEHLEAVSAAEVSDFVSAAEEAERYGFIHIVSGPTGRAVAMAHDLLRDVVHRSLSSVRGAAMHRAIAAHLSTQATRAELAPVIAHHAVLADNPSLAVRACLEAAESCAAWRGTHEAEELVELGLHHAEQLAPPERQQRQIELLQILVRVRRPSNIDELIERLKTLGTEVLELGGGSHAQLAFHLIGYLRWDHDDPWRAHQGVLQALQVSQATSADRAMGLAASAMCLALLEQDLPKADALLVEAEIHAREMAQPPAELDVARGLLYRHRGALAAAREAFEQARTRARNLGDRPGEARALEHQMLVELEDGHAESARQLAQSLAELSPRIREGGEGPLAAVVLALLEEAPAATRAMMSPALAELRRLDDKRRLAIALNRFALRELAQGELEAAHAHAEEAWTLATRLVRPSEAAIASALLMTIAARRDDDDTYALAEERLAALEAEHNLSAEARALIQPATSTGGAQWSS